MVRNTARWEQARRAAALTPSTPQSFVPSRPRRARSSGLFDVDGAVTHVDSGRAWPVPTPSLILPITGPGIAGSSAVSSFPPLPPLPVVPRRKKTFAAPKPTTRDRVSDAVSMLGFAAAWIATTGLGAIVVATIMTRNQPPPPTMLAVSPAAPVVEAQAPCAKSWEPPLVAVTDLPVAPGNTRTLAMPVWSQAHYAALPAARPPAVNLGAPRHFEGASIAAARKTESTPQVSLRGSRAKSAPAQSTSAPHSLEDWIRRAVTTDAKHPHSS